MKSKFLLVTLLALPVSLLVAAEKHSGHGSGPNAAASPAEAELIAKARATYPLKTCLVSDEALGSMGEATPYIHRVAGKPDRVVFFCCDGCSDDFKANPEKFLKKVDAAAKARPAKGKKA
jgi:YHS domain-containing protein